MSEKKLHIIWIIANCKTAPYFNWFAEKAAASQNINITFVCLYHERPQMIDDMKSFGWDCHWLKYDPNKRKVGLLKTTVTLTRLLRKLKPDIIHSHLFDDSLVAMVAGKFSRIPNRIVTKGDTGFHFNYTPKWIIFDRIINRLATTIVAISNESKEFIVTIEKANPLNVVMIHHGIPTSIYTHSDNSFINHFKQENQLENSFVVGTVSRFIEWKGYKDIIQVAENLISKIPTIKFLLVGTGQQKQEIIELINEKKLQQYFCLPGYINPKDMPSIYASMNAYLHAARLEPFGFVIAEAMAAGIPVVSTPTGAARDVIISGENGWLAEYNNIHQLSDNIFKVYKNNIETPWEPAQKSAVSQYDFDTMFQNHMNLYHQTIK